MVKEKDHLKKDHSQDLTLETPTANLRVAADSEEEITAGAQKQTDTGMHQPFAPTATGEEMGEAELPKWFSLRVISGKEKKIKQRIEFEVERSGWKNIVLQVVVPTEKVFKMKNGKKVMQERNLLPGYILIEAIHTKLKGNVAKAINDIQNVIHFLGKENPVPMSTVEAHRLLGIVDDQVESAGTLVEPFIVGEPVRITDGPFTDFIGEIQKIDDEKKKLTVIVKIFGRGTKMELSYAQVEKTS